MFPPPCTGQLCQGYGSPMPVSWAPASSSPPPVLPHLDVPCTLQVRSLLGENLTSVHSDNVQPATARRVLQAPCTHSLTALLGTEVGAGDRQMAEVSPWPLRAHGLQERQTHRRLQHSMTGPVTKGPKAIVGALRRRPSPLGRV